MLLRVFIENEAGARRKNLYDERTLVHQGTVEVSAAYPFPYGFVLDTVGGDGDALDCFVLTGSAVKSGTMVECEAAGLLEQVEDGEIDHKLLAVLPGAGIAIDEAAIAALECFVAKVFAHVPGKRMQIGRVRGRTAAEDHVRACRVPGTG